MLNRHIFTYTNTGDKQIMHLFLHRPIDSLSPERSGKAINFRTRTGFQFNLISTQSKNYELTPASDDLPSRSSIILVVHDK